MAKSTKRKTKKTTKTVKKQTAKKTVKKHSAKKTTKSTKKAKTKKSTRKPAKRSTSTSKTVKVTIYSTPTCPYCIAAKDFLDEHKIRYKDIDVSADMDAAQKMVEMTGQMSVPVIVIGKDYIVGFDKEKIKKKLKIK